MRHAWLHLIVTGVVAQSLAFAQLPGNGSASTLRFDNGVIANGTYANECLGFSLPIPAGWEVNSNVTPDGKARHLSGNSFALLFLRQQKGELPGGSIILNAWDATGQNQNKSAEEYVTDAVRVQVSSHADGATRELTRAATAVDYGGKHFVRSDYKTVLKSGTSLYLSYVFTKFRGYFIGETLESRSPEGLDQAVNSLQAISFREDQVNTKCVISTEDASSAGIVGGIVSSTPGMPRIAQPMLVRVSSGVATGLLVTKISPEYPDTARQARIQGLVVLKALIDKEGNVEDLTLVSGHPMLAPSAVEAVKQWKYKPYLLNGQPVKVETQIIVNFQLAP